MARSDTDSSSGSAETLSALFDRGFCLHTDVLSSSSCSSDEAFQSNVKKAILLLEDATRLVSILDVFSSNEHVSEIHNEHLKYLLLPALLGDLHGKLKLDDPVDEREDLLDVMEAYYRDFLQRCNDYEVVNVVIPKKNVAGEEEEAGGLVPAAAASAASRPPDLAKMNAEREAKIKRFREQKELEERLQQLRPTILGQHASDQRDEELVREFYLKTLRRFAYVSLDELAAQAQERPILRHMKKMRAAGRPVVPPARASDKKRPLKPIVITRDAAQKEVFGLGYKNLPILSIEEFYEQRVRDGWFPAPGAAKQSSSALQDRANVDERAAEEEEARVKEEKEERDDEEELARKRRWDNYTDEHRRGEGNRHNMG